MTLTPNQHRALILFSTHTRGRFDVYQLAGRNNVDKRSEILTALRGVKLPQSQCGITILEEQFMAMAGIDPSTMTLHEARERLVSFCNANVGI